MWMGEACSRDVTRASSSKSWPREVSWSVSYTCTHLHTKKETNKHKFTCCHHGRSLSIMSILLKRIVKRYQNLHTHLKLGPDVWFYTLPFPFIAWNRLNSRQNPFGNYKLTLSNSVHISNRQNHMTIKVSSNRFLYIKVVFNSWSVTTCAPTSCSLSPSAKLCFRNNKSTQTNTVYISIHLDRPTWQWSGLMRVSYTSSWCSISGMQPPALLRVVYRVHRQNPILGTINPHKASQSTSLVDKLTC